MINKNKHKRKIDSVKHFLDKWHDNLCPTPKKNPFSVWNQINRMLWNDAWYRTLNQGLRLANDKKQKINGHLWRFITTTYVESQTLSIRKLIDKGDDVISLIRLIDCLNNQGGNMSREFYLLAHQDKIESKDDNDHWNKQFDALSEKNPANRNSSDTVSLILLEKMKKNLLEDCGHIKTHVDKFVAHAADKKSVDKFKSQVCLNMMEQAQKTVCQVFYFLSVNLFGDSFAGFIQTYTEFEGLENGFVLENDREKIEAFWDSHSSKVNQWTDYRDLLNAVSVENEVA